MDGLQEVVCNNLFSIRKKSPLVLNLTNYVGMDLTANALLALGASPLMTEATEELEELLTLSQALVINIGTLNPSFVERATRATQLAKKYSKPTVLDPVGAGATSLRTATALSLLESETLTVVRANASEMNAILGGREKTKGVDSSLSSVQVIEKAKSFSLNSDTVLTVSGETDFVFQRGKSVSIKHGDPLMTQVTAMGCTASSLLGAFLAVTPSPFEAALSTMAVMGIAGEKARKKAEGPGTFRVHFLDALAALGEKDFADLKVKFNESL